MLKDFNPVGLIALLLHHPNGVFYFMQEKEELGMFVLFPTKLLEILTPRQAVIMGMIIGMAKKSGYAYPSNRAIGNILNMTTITVQRELAILEENGMITRELIRNEKLEVVMRRIYPHINLNGEVISNVIGGVVTDLIPPSYQNCNIYKDNTKSINNKDITTFETIWSLYKKKGVKQTAKKAFDKLNQAEVELIQNHIPKYIERHEEAEKMDFIPHLSTYLNQKRWNDELPYSPKKSKENETSTQITNKNVFNLKNYE
jgi:DNA-binding transcriptional regulator YhcF (GntR family)